MRAAACRILAVMLVGMLTAVTAPAAKAENLGLSDDRKLIFVGININRFGNGLLGTPEAIPAMAEAVELYALRAGISEDNLHFIILDEDPDGNGLSRHEADKGHAHYRKYYAALDELISLWESAKVASDGTDPARTATRWQFLAPTKTNILNLLSRNNQDLPSGVKGIPRLRDDDIVVFYLSSHGIQAPETDIPTFGLSGWNGAIEVPEGSKNPSSGQTIGLDEIAGYLTRQPATTYMFIDTCRTTADKIATPASNSYIPEMKDVSNYQPRLADLRSQVENARNKIFLIASARAGQRSYIEIKGASGNITPTMGIFTRALTEALKEPVKRNEKLNEWVSTQPYMTMGSLRKFNKMTVDDLLEMTDVGTKYEIKANNPLLKNVNDPPNPVLWRSNVIVGKPIIPDRLANPKVSYVFTMRDAALSEIVLGGSAGGGLLTSHLVEFFRKYDPHEMYVDELMRVTDDAIAKASRALPDVADADMKRYFRRVVRLKQLFDYRLFDSLQSGLNVDKSHIVAMPEARIASDKSLVRLRRDAQARLSRQHEAFDWDKPDITGSSRPGCEPRTSSLCSGPAGEFDLLIIATLHKQLALSPLKPLSPKWSLTWLVIKSDRSASPIHNVHQRYFSISEQQQLQTFLDDDSADNTERILKAINSAVDSMVWSSTPFHRQPFQLMCFLPGDGDAGDLPPGREINRALAEILGQELEHAGILSVTTLDPRRLGLCLSGQAVNDIKKHHVFTPTVVAGTFQRIAPSSGFRIWPRIGHWRFGDDFRSQLADELAYDVPASRYEAADPDARKLIYLRAAVRATASILRYRNLLVGEHGS